MNSDPTVLLEDRFTVTSCDNSKFENVTRIRGKSAAFDADIVLDVNTHIYPVKEKEVRRASRLTSLCRPCYSCSQNTCLKEAIQQGAMTAALRAHHKWPLYKTISNMSVWGKCSTKKKKKYQINEPYICLSGDFSAESLQIKKFSANLA